MNILPENYNKIASIEIKLSSKDRYNHFLAEDGFDSCKLIGFLYEDDEAEQSETPFSLTYIFDKGRNRYVIVFKFTQYSFTGVIQPVADGIPVSNLYVENLPDEKEKTICFKDESNKFEIRSEKVEVIVNEMRSCKDSNKLRKKKTEDYSDYLERKLKQLNKDEDKDSIFTRDDSYNGIPASHHTIYKVKPSLESKDKSLEYEFLIELDRNDPCLGIYYGCRVSIKNGKIEDKIKELDEQWEKRIKDKVIDRLNNTFVNCKFDNRFKPTDNANDNTYWPFWISLYDDENIIQVAAQATVIIRDEYKRDLEGDEYKPEPDKIHNSIFTEAELGKGEVEQKYAFKKENYKDLLTLKGYKNKEERWEKHLEDFIKKAIEKNILKEADYYGYEKAWIIIPNDSAFNDFDFDDFAFIEFLFLVYINVFPDRSYKLFKDLESHIEEIKKDEKVSTREAKFPWERIGKVFFKLEKCEKPEKCEKFVPLNIESLKSNFNRELGKERSLKIFKAYLKCFMPKVKVAISTNKNMALLS